MTVSMVSAIHWYVGLSTDTKPTDAPVGSRFYAFDGTPAWWIWDGSDWHDLT